MNHIEFRNLLLKQPMYIKNTYEDAVIRSSPTQSGVEYWVKFKGKHEIRPSERSVIVTDALLEQNIITKEEYDKF